MKYMLIDLAKLVALIVAMTCLALSVIPFVLSGIVMFGLLAVCDYLAESQ